MGAVLAPTLALVRIVMIHLLVIFAVRIRLRRRRWRGFGYSCIGSRGDNGSVTTCIYILVSICCSIYKHYCDFKYSLTSFSSIPSWRANLDKLLLTQYYVVAVCSYLHIQLPFPLSVLASIALFVGRRDLFPLPPSFSLVSPQSSRPLSSHIRALFDALSCFLLMSSLSLQFKPGGCHGGIHIP